MGQVTSFGPYLARKSASEMQQRLDHWMTWLRSDRNLALGADPLPVYQIEQDLLRMRQTLHNVLAHFESSAQLSSEEQGVSAVIGRIDEALQFVREVRERDRGSQLHTRTCLILLARCIDGILYLTDQLLLQVAQTY